MNNVSTVCRAAAELKKPERERKFRGGLYSVIKKQVFVIMSSTAG